MSDIHLRLKKKTLTAAASITIATWLDERHELRRRIQRGKTESIIVGFTEPEELESVSSLMVSFFGFFTNFLIKKNIFIFILFSRN